MTSVLHHHSSPNTGRHLYVALALATMAPGCARPDERMRIDPVVVNDVLTRAAEQIRRCYRTPRIPHAARQIVTSISVRFNPDGSLAQLPVWNGQDQIDPAIRPYAAQLAEAASLAVIRCTPLTLPAEHYASIWQQFELTFRFSSRG